MSVGDSEFRCSYADVDCDFENALRRKKYGNVYQFIFTLQKTEWVDNFEYRTDYRIRKMEPGYRFNIFFDRGDGWLEENRASCGVTGTGKWNYEIEVENGHEIKGLRIDPLDRNVLIKDFKFILEGEDDSREIFPSECILNGIYNKCNNEILFDTDDPQIILNRDILDIGQLKRIKVECTFISINMNSSDIERNKNIFGDITRLNEELTRCKQELKIYKN